MKRALEIIRGCLRSDAKALALPSLTGSSDAFLALALATGKDPRFVLAVTSGIPDAERLTDDLRLLVAEPGTEASCARVMEFPPLLSDDRSALGLRLKTIAALKSWSLSPYPAVVVAPYQALVTPLPAGTLPSVTLAVAEGAAKHKFGDVGAMLAKYGYRRVPQVESEGDYSVRGGIVDVWSPGEEYPFRAEFFGDDLESLRTFNPATQVSIARIDAAELLPVYQGDGEGASDGGTLFDLLPPAATVLALEHNDYSLGSLSSVICHLSSVIYTGDPPPPGVPSAPFPTAPLPGFAELGADEAHHPELFDAARKRLEQHIAAAKKRGDIVLELDALSGGFELSAFSFQVLASGFQVSASGFQLSASESKLKADSSKLEADSSKLKATSSKLKATSILVVTKADRVFTKHSHFSRRGVNAAVAQGPRLNDFDDLEPGEYVVHVDYGVGRYVGSSEIVSSDGTRSEVFTIEYADGGKLHVPAAHAHLLSRYVGVKGEAVRMHRLDGKRWEKDKKEAQRAVTDLAASLLETQAKRDLVPGYSYDVACDGREAFDAAFPYEETPDQIAAIAAIDRDLAARKPMDRLVCGDAGYGKTEVAMRAAYVVAMNGRQVAVLAPTTVLAEQHFETFTSRFDGTPVRIESVSRFQTAGTHRGTFQRIATGVCDIVIGTHAILSNKIAFHDLGLIIIDEEQRFGVRHKEFLKRLRATAEVLTLSATPIPRTLYLSMTGARDLSLLRSPPQLRVAVETKIVRDSDEIIRGAIEAELARGGQVFFLHNRVASIHTVEKRLMGLFEVRGSRFEVPGSRFEVRGSEPGTRNLMPRICVAHGQMDSATLAKKMRDFERGEYDILLSTTIVESGIDIPRANTILVSDAQNFGMADLYQLRGRVGRSSRQGYAYFLLPPSGLVDSDARERLDALKRHGGLGSGFNLAVRDLELRGAGNLLGSQQSGHIAAVGFGLYCQLLKRTIAMMKGEKVREVVDVQLNLDFAAPRLPYEYIEEDVQRLSLMKRFAEAQDVRVVRALAAEMKDRFGPLPPEAEEYVRIAELRVLAANAGFSNVDVKGSRVVFYRAGSRDIAAVRELKGRTPPRKLAELRTIVKDF